MWAPDSVSALLFLVALTAAPSGRRGVLGSADPDRRALAMSTTVTFRPRRQQSPQETRETVARSQGACAHGDVGWVGNWTPDS